MKVRMFSEEDILKPEFRQKVLTEIAGPENIARKRQALRAHEMYKGRIRKWVVEQLLKEFDGPTVEQMKNRATNINVLKKVVNKLATTYDGGVERSLGEDKESKDNLTKVAEALCMNTSMKKVDKFYELFFNTSLQVIPVPNYRESTPDKPKFDIFLRVLAPHYYDVVEDSNNRTEARVYILSDFLEANSTTHAVAYTVDDEGKRIAREAGVVDEFEEGDRVRQTIADADVGEEGEKQEFIWWSDKYHFTTDGKGVIIADKSDGVVNPISELPFVNYAGDQDGQFWAVGSEERVLGALGINVSMTDMLCIAMIQGWGQPVMTGENFPEKVKGGPHNAIMLKQEHGAAESKFYYASSNPPLDQWMAMVEQLTALYLSTNNLSPTTVSAKLDASNMASGIAMLIDKSESHADIQSKREMFGEKETPIFQKVKKWQDVLSASKSLSEKWSEVPTLPDVKQVSTTFFDAKPVTSEKERLETLKLLKDLGLETLEGLVRRANPEMKDDEIKRKVAELVKERAANAAAFGAPTEGKDSSGNPSPDEKADDESPAKPGEPVDDEKPAEDVVEEEKA